MKRDLFVLLNEGGLNTMANEWIKITGIIKEKYAAIMALATMIMLTPTQLLAVGTVRNVDTSGLFYKIESLFGQVYQNVFKISTVVACTSVAIALVLIMLSRNERNIESGTRWIKRILACYFVLNCLGLVFGYIQNLSAGYNY